MIEQNSIFRNICIFGCGNYGKMLYESIKSFDGDIVGIFCDNNSIVNGAYSVITPSAAVERIKACDLDAIVIPSSYSAYVKIEMITQLSSLKVRADAIYVADMSVISDGSRFEFSCLESLEDMIAKEKLLNDLIPIVYSWEGEHHNGVESVPLLTKKYTPVISSTDKWMHYKNHYGMWDYHNQFFNDLTSSVDLSGKAVLEIGGSNTPVELAIGEIGAKKWVCVDKPSKRMLINHKVHYEQIKILKFDQDFLDTAMQEHDYIVFDEFAEEIPESFFGKFDVCISNCSFEHVLNLPEVLDVIYNSLKKGGVFHTSFAGIWSAPNGNHVCLKDDNHAFSYSFVDLPEELHHCHLLWGYKEIYSYLENRYDDAIAKKYAIIIKNGHHYPRTHNKLLYEDYLFILSNTSFDRKSLSPNYFHPGVKDANIRQLQRKFPGYYRFDVSGILMQAIK